MARNNVIRAGDIVRIKNPEFFIRCGYPLSIQDGIKQLMDTQSEDYRKITEFADYFGLSKNILNVKKDFQQIIRILAYYKIQEQNFGGRERKIYTQFVETAKDHEFEVIGKQTVVTGYYVPATGRSSMWNDEYEPPYLDDPKVHVILSLYDGSVDGHFYYVNNTLCLPQLKIEQIHVEKVTRPKTMPEIRANNIWQEVR